VKPLPRSNEFSAFFNEARVYRDDLQRILALIGDSGLTTKISDNTVEYESLDEFQETRGNSPREIRIEGTTSSPYSSVRLSLLGGRHWHLFSYGEINYGLVHDIENLLKNRQNTLAYLPYNTINTVGFIISLTSIGATLLLSARAVRLTLAIISMVMIFPSLALMTYLRFHRRLVLNYKHEAGFFLQNRDKIFLLLIGAAIGTLFTFLLWYFTGKSV